MDKVFVVVQYEKGREDGLVEVKSASVVYNEAKKYANFVFAKYGKEYDVYIDTYKDNMLFHQEKINEENMGLANE
jgi:CTP:phosphocholine cytidylyltransferase-like protein